MSAACRARPAARTLRTADRSAAACGLSARNRSAVQGGRRTYSRDHRTARATAPRVSCMPVICASADRLRRLPVSAAQKAKDARAAAPRRPSRRARHRPIRSRTSPHDGAPLPRRPSLFVQGCARRVRPGGTGTGTADTRTARARKSPRGLLIFAVPLGAVLPRVHEARGHLRHVLALLGARVRDDAVVERDAHLTLVRELDPRASAKPP